MRGGGEERGRVGGVTVREEEGEREGGREGGKEGGREGGRKREGGWVV